MAKDSDEAFLGDERQLEILRYLLYVFNSIFFIAAAMVFAGGMYVSYDSSMGDYMGGLYMDAYWNATAVLMTASTLVVLNSIIGCCAGFLISRKALICHIGLMVVTFVMLLGTSAYLLANGLEQSNLYPYIQDTMRDLIYQYEWDIQAKRSVDIIQEYIGCCGGSGANDYIDIHLPIPNTCRDQVTGNQYGDSCAEVFSWFMEKRTGWMCGISLCICFLEILCVITALYARRDINRIRRKM